MTSSIKEDSNLLKEKDNISVPASPVKRRKSVGNKITDFFSRLTKKNSVVSEFSDQRSKKSPQKRVRPLQWQLKNWTSALKILPPWLILKDQNLREIVENQPEKSILYPTVVPKLHLLPKPSLRKMSRIQSCKSFPSH